MSGTRSLHGADIGHDVWVPATNLACISLC